MSNKFRIVHITPTPLVGAPGKIARALRIAGHEAFCIMLADYPQKGPLSKKFLSNGIVYSKELASEIDLIIKNAQIIHIHNYLSQDWINHILSLNSNARFVYHTHSPLREGPLYIERSGEMGIDFSAKLVVGQAQSRFYADFTPVPNLVFEVPSLNLIDDNTPIKIIFSPTHKHIGRWNSKYTPGLVEFIKELENKNLCSSLLITNPVEPSTLFDLRRNCHITIDEIATGGFHQVSLEGLFAGNLVINDADFFSKAIFSQFAASEMPPFIQANSSNYKDVISEILADRNLLRTKQIESYNYAVNYLNPTKMIKYYERVYEDIL